MFLAQSGPNGQPSAAVCVGGENYDKVIAYNGNELYLTEQPPSAVDSNAITAKLADIYDIGNFDSIHWSGSDDAELSRDFIIIE